MSKFIPDFKDAPEWANFAFRDDTDCWWWAELEYQMYIWTMVHTDTEKIEPINASAKVRELYPTSSFKFMSKMRKKVKNG